MNIAKAYHSVDKFMILNISEATMKDTYQKILTLKVEDYNSSEISVLVYPDIMENREKFLDYYRNRVVLMVKLGSFKKEREYQDGIGNCDTYYHIGIRLN
jgi:hypothetical protein